MKTLVEILGSDAGHWVGDGFPVRSLFSYSGDTRAISPFLLFDHAGPWTFAPNAGPPRGVGQHPHRGFETVTIVYDGEVSHRDSAGGGGTIGRGEVQWMTAGAGVIHEEYHSERFSNEGGPFHMVQLWVNLPAKDKLVAPRYQAITRDMIPEVAIPGGNARIIAGEFGGTRGPAATFSPVELWDLRLDGTAPVALPLPAGHNAMIAVLDGEVRIDGQPIPAGRIARLTSTGAGAQLDPGGPATVLVLGGEPIDEPVIGQGPFVMNTEAEIRQAFADYQTGRFAASAA